jgi:hypothetical protein
MVDDLPILLWWSLLIAGSTTLKASVSAAVLPNRSLNRI